MEKHLKVFKKNLINNVSEQQHSLYQKLMKNEISFFDCFNLKNLFYN